MAHHLPQFDKEGYNQAETGFYDSQDPEREAILADAVVDVTDLLPGVAEQIVLKYAHDSRRHFILLCDRDEEDVDLGRSTLCHLDTPKTEEQMRVVADRWDIGLERLVEIVEAFRPE